MCQKIDMDSMREIMAKWRIRNPSPDIPTKEAEYWRENSDEMLAIKHELELSRSEAIAEWKKRQKPVPDLDDNDYKEELERYLRVESVIMASECIMRGVLVLVDGNYMVFGEAVSRKHRSKSYATMKQVKSDWDEFKKIFQFIVDLSELNQALIERKIDEFGYTWHGSSLIEIWQGGGIPKGDTSSTWVALGAVAASEIEKIGPVKFQRLEIDEQASIIAIYLSQSWLNALRSEQRKREAEDRRLNNVRR